MKRQHSPTSKAGEQHIKPFKPNHKQKILEALERSKIGCTYEEAAKLAGMRDDQVWKRLSEMEKDGTIFNTGITRKLKSGLGGSVWQIAGLLPVSAPKTTAQQKATKEVKTLTLFQ